MSILARSTDRNAHDFLHNVPDTLYKYRDWGNEYHQKLLTEGELYFATANQFNDPFDFSLPYKWKQEDLTDDNIFLKLLSSLKAERSDLTDEEMHQMCFDQQNEGLFHDKAFIKEINEKFRDMEHKMLGIVSLTNNPNNFLMWSHYSNSHKGFVVGFDKKKLFDATEAGFGVVDYKVDIPTYDIFDDLMDKAITQILTKAQFWNYEDEYRLFSTQYVSSAVDVSSAITDVILGCNMTQEQIMKIIQLVEDRYPNVQIYQAFKNEDEYKVDIGKIQLFKK